MFVRTIRKMCQLLGVSSNRNVDIQISLREFRLRGKANPHGWGYAYIQEGIWKLSKKPDTLKSEDIKAEPFQFKSKYVIAHVRKMSCGVQNHENTHPFQINSWVFAHNGDVRRIMGNADYKLTKFRPKGETDSEYAFCYLLEKIGNEKDIGKIKAILELECDKIKEHGNFNILLSNGEALFAHGHDSLHFVQRKYPFQKITLIGDTTMFDLQEFKNLNEKAIIIATEPITKGENWSQIKGLKVFRNGAEI